MSTEWGPWAWVAAAWSQLVIAYVGYVVYLSRRRRTIRDAEDVPS